MRRGFVFFLAGLLMCGVALAQQTEVKYSDDFQSYGSPKTPPGWVDTAIGASLPDASGLFKTWPDPTQGNKATNLVFGSKSASGNPDGNNPRIGHFSTLTTKTFSGSGRFEYRGRFLRTNTDSRIGLTVLSSYPEKDQYYLIGLWSVPNSPTLTMQLFGFGTGTFSGTTNSNFTPAANAWYRFLIQVDDVDGATTLRARFWADGTAEPSTFSIEATDSAPTRLTSGRVGVWGAVKGANYFDNLVAKSPVDYTAPVITFAEGGRTLSPHTVTAVKDVARVDVTATDDLSGVASLTATRNGEPYVPLTPITAEGPHVIAARAVDNVRNASTSETTVLVDATNPIITLTAGGTPLPLPTSYFNTAPAIAIEAKDAWTGATYTATLDGQSYVSGTAIGTEGTHHLVVEATDGVTHKTIVQATIVVDFGGPVIEFYAKGAKPGPRATFQVDPGIEVRLTDTYSTPTYTATLDGATWKSLDPVPTGWHKIVVHAVDQAGNPSEATLDVLVDGDKPVVVLRESPSETILDPAVTAKYRHDVALGITISDPTSAVASSSTTLDGQPYTSGTQITTEQNTHTLTVTAQDEAGNTTTVTLAVLLDKTPPVISFSESGVKLDARDLQKFRRDASIVIDVTDSISQVTSTATLTTHGTTTPYVSGTPITVEDAHTLLVQAVDDAGNTAEATLQLIVDKTPPVIAFSESNNALDTTQETPFGRNVAVDIRVTDNLPGITSVAKLDGGDYVSGTEITTDGHHVVSVRAIDRAENTTDASVKLLIDKTGPEIGFFESNVELDVTKRNDFNRLPSIEIRATDALSTVTYEATIDGAAYGSKTPVAEGFHTIAVHATDARGNATDAKIELLVDANAPIVKLIDRQSGNELGSDAGIFARELAVDAVIQDISKTTTVATLDGQPFSLSLPVSEDRVGHRLEVTVTDQLQWKTTVATTFTVDKTPPVLAVTEGTAPLLGGASFARDIVINVAAEDITPVSVTATIDGQPYRPGDTYGANGPHDLVVNATDAAGNHAQPVALKFYIDKNAPEVTLLESGQPFPQAHTFAREIVATATISAATETTTVATIDGTEYTLGAPYAVEGHHHLKVVVTNVAGLSTTVEVDFTVDKTPPTLELHVRHGENDELFRDAMQFSTDAVPYTVADDNLANPPKVVMLLDGQELTPATPVTEEKFHTISATATDEGGSSTTVGPFHFVVDKTPPEISVTVDGEPLTDGAQFNKAITPAIEAEDLTTLTWDITLDGAPYTRGTAIENDLEHTLVVRVLDELHNERKLDPIHFTIDKTAPIVQVIDKETNEPFTGGKFKRPVTAIVRIVDLTGTITNATIVNRRTGEESPWTSEQEISSDGHYTLNVTVTDELQWVTVVPPIEFTIDQAAPVVAVTEHDVPLVTNSIFNRDAQPKIIVDDTTDTTVEATLNGEPFTSETFVTEERQHTLRVKATDELGFITELLPILFTVDKTPPVVTVTENGKVFTDQALLDHDAVPQVVVADLTVTSIDARVDGEPFAVGGSVVTEGPHTLDVTVTDAAGWKTVFPTIHFVIDKTAPIVTVTETENGNPLDSGEEFGVTITPWVHVSDITATTIAAKLNGAAWVPNTPVGEEGKYVLEVNVTDAAGHVTTVPPIAFSIDKSAPIVRILESGQPFVSGTKLNRPAQLAIKIDDLTNTATAATVGETPFTFPGTIAQDGKHTLSVTVTDNLGHATVVPPIAFVVDQTRPLVTITESGQPLEPGAAFNRNVRPEIAVSDLTETTTVATLNGAPFTFGTEITNEGKYTLVVEVTDELGWTTVVPAIVFFIDRTPPVVTLKEGEQDLTDGLWFNRAVEPRAVIVDTTATRTTAMLLREGGTAQPYELQTPITEEGKYTLSVTVTDAVGLETNVPPVSFTIDMTPPAITFKYPPADAALTSPQIIVVGDTDDAVSVTVNEIDTTIDESAKEYATNGAIELLEGENTLVAFGIDRAGNNTTIAEVVHLDTRAPELAITSPVANACMTTRTVEVTGTVADLNVAGIRLSITPGTLAPVDAIVNADRRTWTATVQLPSEGRFVLTATARDNGGHESSATVAVNVDETKPRIEITADGAPIAPFINRTITPLIRAIDADAKAALTVTLDGAPYVSGTPIEAEKNYELKASATDCAGHKSDDVVVSFVIDKTAPQFVSLSPESGATVGTMATVGGIVSADVVSVVEEGGTAATVTNGAFAFASLPVIEGLNRFVLIAVDRAGNATRIDYSFRVKTSAPTVEIVENGSPIVNGGRYNREVAVDIRSNEADATLTATHNGQPFSSGTVVSENGSHTISATARDSFGHSSSKDVTFTIDRTGPVVTITEPLDGATINADHVRVRGTISGEPVSATINGASVTVAGGAFDSDVALEIGINDIVVIALDSDGNVGQASVEVTRGGGSLGLILTSPQNGTLTNRRTTAVAGQVLSPAGIDHVTVNGVDIPVDAAGTFRQSEFALQEGENVITATVAKGDARGSVTVRVTADFTPPAVIVRESGNALGDEARFGTRAEITVEASDNGQTLTPELYIDAAPATPPATVTAAGGHTLVALARDAAGNERRVERTFFIGSGGTAGCALSDFDPADQSVVTSNTITLVGRTGGAAGVKVNGSSAIVANGTFTANVNLPVEGANSVTITCTDASGDATGTPATITLTRVTGSPSITIGSPNDQAVTADESITVSGTISSDTTEAVVNGAAATISGTTFTATTVRLAAGVNIIVARAKNAAGRTSSDSVRVTRLAELPSITITSPSGAFTTTAPTIDVSGVWTNLDPASLTVGDAAAQTVVNSDTTGTFKAAIIALDAGTQTIVVRGTDRLGRAATASVAITRVDGTPSIAISEPADNSYFGIAAGDKLTVSGTFNAAAGATVEVNGVAATIDETRSTFTASVDFSAVPSGLTPVVARVTEPAGNSSVDIVRVTRFSAAPTILQGFPDADAANVSAGALPLVLFSQSMNRTAVRNAFRLENAAGTPISGEVTLDRDLLTFAPAVLLDAGERYTIRISTAAQDLGGNALAEAFTSSFTVAATAPATAPSLDPYPSRVCEAIDLSGTAPANARLRIELGTLAFALNASETGAFTFHLPLTGRGGYQVARVRVVGTDGSLSPAAEASFQVDCAGPQVTDATFDRTTNLVTIMFSKPVDAATITVGAAGSIRLQLLDGTSVSGTASSTTPAVVSLTPAQNLTEESFTLTVTTAVKDADGVALSSAFSRVFALGDLELVDGSGYITGEIFDADTGRPLAGATVSIDVPLGAFGRHVAGQTSTASESVSSVADNRGRYVRALPEGAYTIRASADEYTSVWRQIIVRPGVGAIPTDIRLSRHDASKASSGDALVLTSGGVGEKPLSRKGELRIPAGVVAAGMSVTFTSLGAQSLPGLLPLGWSPLASCEIVTNATSLSGVTLLFDVPQDALTASSQTLTAVQYDDGRDEWRVMSAVVAVSSDGKASIPISAAGAYALVYPDKAPHLQSPPVPSSGGVLAGVADPCATAPCPPLVAASALELSPAVVVPTQRTVATLRVAGADPTVFPSGTAVQAYVDEELHLADGRRDVVSPFVTDLLLYRSLAGETGEASFHLAPSARAAEVVLQVGYDHIRIQPYPERIDRGALIGPEGGRVPADDRVAVEIPTGATSEAIKATATSVIDFARYGTIAGYRIVGGLSLSLQWAGAGEDSTAVELLKPARATFTVNDTPLHSQLILVEVLDGTQYGRVFRLAAQITALEGGVRFTTKAIDRAVLPVDGIIREGTYLLLAPEAPIAFATGTVHLGENGAAVGGARVLTPSLGVADLTRLTGIFNIPVPIPTFTLVPRTPATGDGATYSHATPVTADQVVNVGALSIVAQPPSVSMTVFAQQQGGVVEVPANGATGVSPTTTIKAMFTPGVDASSVRSDSLVVIDQSGNVVPGHATAQGAVGIVWSLEPGTQLRLDARFTAIVSGSVRGANGTPLGTPVAASFSTASAIYDANVDPTKIRITMPDANGRSSIIGAPGALHEHWNAVAVRVGRDFSTRPQATADSQWQFRIELGTSADPNDRITIADEIYLQIINDAGAVAAIVPLGPFTTADGRGFVARADKETRYTTPDQITLTVPADAFDVPTLVNVGPEEKTAVADVPGLEEELAVQATFRVDFEGIAKKRLDVSFPAPASLPAEQSAYLGFYGQSIRGPRIMVIDLLRREGANLTTVPATTGASRVEALSRNASVGSTAIVNPTVLRDMLLGIDRSGILIGFTFQTAVNWVTFQAPSAPADFFIPPIKSIYYASFAAERDRILVPIPANRPFNIVGVDPGSGLTIVDAPFDARQPGEPGDAGEIGLPSPNEFGPYPVFASPARAAIVDLNSDHVVDDSIRNLVVKFDAPSTLKVSNSTTAPLPENTHVDILDVHGGLLYRTDNFSDPVILNASLGDRLVFLIGEQNVDPSDAVITVVFSEPIALPASQEERRNLFKLLVANSGTSLDFKPVVGDVTIQSDSGGRRISIVHPGGFHRGSVYRLKLSKNITDQDPTLPLKIGQRVVGPPENRTATAALPDDLILDFQVREPKGQIGSFNISGGSVRDLAMTGNILFVSALEGGIQAYDVSNPAALTTSTPQPIGTIAPPIGTDGQTWALATDHHGRLFATALSPMYGLIRSYRVEDFYAGTPSSPAMPEQSGNAIVAWRPGINVGVPLASMMIGGWPEATPRKMHLVTKDSDPVYSTFENDPPPPAPGEPIPGAIGNGFRKISFDVDITPGFKYGKQRITVTNVTRNYSWSKDVEGSASFDIIGKAGDRISVVKNLTTIGVVSLFGHGVGVYDLNAIDANYRAIKDGVADWERLNDTLVLDTGDGGSCGLNTPCNRAALAIAGNSCPITDLAFSPDAGIANVGTGVGVLALEQNRGIAQLTIDRQAIDPTNPDAPTVSCSRTGNLILQEKVNLEPPYGTGRVWSGHPRLNTQRHLFTAAAGRDPIVRYTSIAIYKRGVKTYALVAGNELGLLVAEVGTAPLSRSSLVDVVWIPGGAYSVRVMQDDDVAVVVDGKGYVLLVNLAQIDESGKVPTENPDCSTLDCEWPLFPTVKAALTPITTPSGTTIAVPNNADGVGFDDPRVVWKSSQPLVQGTLAPIVDSETGFIYTGDVLGQKVNVVSGIDPKVRFIGPDGSDATRARELDQVIPLGIQSPASPTGSQTPAGYAAAFRVLVSLPGSITETLGSPGVPVALESERVLRGVTSQTPKFLPRAHLRQKTPSGANDPRSVNFTLQHDAPTQAGFANLRYQRGWNRMLSKWVVAIADPRASDAYEWSGTVTAQQKADQGCYSCGRPSFVTGTLGTDWYELYTAGRIIAVRPEIDIFNGTAYQHLGDGRMENRIGTIMADTVRPTQVLTAAHGAPVSAGAHQETFFLHSGEVMTSTVDLDAGGRAGWNVVVDRTYRSRTIGLTPFGAGGWDSSIFQRLRLLPDKNVEYRDGSGEVWLFRYGTSGYDSPEGFDLKLSRLAAGWRMTDAKQRITDYDNYGRIVAEADEFYDLSQSTGNLTSYSYDAEGRLERIVDAVGRPTTFTYNGDLLDTVTDWRQRQVAYHIDADKRLLNSVELPKIQHVALAYGMTQDPVQTYEYDSAGSSVTDQLELATNLKNIYEPGHEARVSFGYELSGAKRDMVTTETWHTTDNATAHFTYTLGSADGLPVATEAVVFDALKQKRTYTLTPAPKDFSSVRSQTRRMVEAEVPIWSDAKFGALPENVSYASYNNAAKDRRWSFEYEPSSADLSVRGRLKFTTLEVDMPIAITETGWEAVVPAGAVLKKRNVTSDAGGIEQSFGHTGVYLDSVTSGGLKVDTPEPRRGNKKTEDGVTSYFTTAKDGNVEITTKHDLSGLVRSVAHAGIADLASQPGASSKIDYYETNDDLHRRALPHHVTDGAGGDQVQAVLEYPDAYTAVATDPNGLETTTKYDEAGHVVSVSQSGSGGVDTEELFAYDERGRLARHRTKQDDGKYVEDQYDYDAVGRVLLHEVCNNSCLSEILQKTTYTYNLPARATITTLPAGGTITDTLDGLGRVQDRTTDTKNPIAQRTLMTERRRYDAHGNLAYTGNDVEASAMKFDGAHRAVETLDSAGIHVKTTIDGFGRLKELEDVTAASGPGLKVTNDFTPAGKLISTTTNTSTTKFAWDGAGRTIRAVSDPKSGTPTTISETAYDTVGRLTKSAFGEGSSADANAPLTRTFETTEWKGYGSRLFPGSILSFEGSSNFTHTPTFDALGGLRNLTTAGAPDMSLTQTLDQVGRIKSVTSPEQRGETKFVYERGGLTTNEIQPPGMSGTSSTITNQVNFTPADGSVLEQYTDASGQATKTERDGLGRTYRRTYADGTIEEIYYDLDRVIKVVDRQGRSQTFNYDPHTGRLDTVVDAGVVLDDLDYDDRGHLTSWKTPDSVVTFSNFDPEGRPQLTTQTRLDASGAAIDSYSQSHMYDGFGRRTSWKMPGAGALTTGWTTEVQPQYDGAGNVTRIDRSVSGGGATGTLLSSEYRTTGRPKTRTLSVNPASPTEIRREYDYDASAGRLKTFKVFVNNTLTAGSDVEHEGTLLKSARLLGIANGERTTSWDYDERGRLKASAAASKDPNAATAMAPKTVLPKLNDVDFIEEIAQVGGTSADKTFGETAAGHKIEHAGDPANAFEYRKADGTDGGGVRTRDAHFLYDFDHKERLRRVTQRPYGGEQFILRIVYSYSGLGRMIGRDVLIAPAAGGTTVPNDSAFAPATAQQLGPDAGLPPRTTFVWDPISDQLVSVFDTDSGQPIRQYIHGGMGLDDPIEVAVAESGRVARYYPIYDEAGDGGLQAVLTESGKIVTRTIITDPYGGDQISIAGPAVEKVTVARAADDGMTIDVAFTEPIDPETLPSGVRLSSLNSANTVVFTSSVSPVLTSADRTVRWTLTSAEWAALANAPDAHALSIAVTEALRSTAYTANARVLAADTTLRSGIYATAETPFELRETFSLLGSRLGGRVTYNAYELITLTAMSVPSDRTSTATSILRMANNAIFADSAASLLLIGSFQALPLAEPVTGLVYARARWYDPSTGSFLTPDPMGYRDSSNLYAFAAGDPVNGRDPTGEFVGAKELQELAQNAAQATTAARIAYTMLSTELYTLGAGGAGEALAPLVKNVAPKLPAVAFGTAIAGAIITPFKVAAVNADADAYVAEAGLLQTQIRTEALKRQRSRTQRLPSLPGVSPYTQQRDSLPDGMQQDVLTQYHNKQVGPSVPPAMRRRLPGRVTGGRKLLHVSGQWLRGTSGNAGLIPGQVAARLRGREFANFDEFRAEFWRTVASIPDLAKQFSPENVANMRSGHSPFVVEEQQVGGQVRYMLHHRTPIQHGGAVYDLDNLMVVTPRYHQEVLSPTDHY